jgi:hypothetical protein
MTRSKLIGLGLVAAAAVFTACKDSTSPVQVVTDAQLNADVAAQSGDAIATDIDALITGESSAGLPAGPLSISDPLALTVNWTKTCYGGGVVQASCNATTTDSVRLAGTVTGSFSSSFTGPHGTETVTAGVHRSRNVSITGLTGTETSRTHNGTGSANDTTTFSGTNDNTTRTRTMALTALDSIQGIVFNLPHNSTTNRWPAAGKYVRYVSGKVTVTAGPNTGERTFSRRIEIDFPPDASGIVTIKINDRTCSLNLNTRAVTACS